jgi:hypothetical protein
MSTELFEKLLHAAADGSPIALLGLAGYVAYLIWKIAGNHLKHLESGIGKIVESTGRLAEISERQTKLLQNVATDIAIVKDRLR